MERGSATATYTGWAATVTRALENPSEMMRDDVSDSVGKCLEVDDQELIPDYRSMQRTEVAASGRVAGPSGLGGPSKPPSLATGAESLPGTGAVVPTEALGSMVAQLMQPWMEQLMNNQVLLLMARMEKMEVARAQSERLSAERLASERHRDEELLSHQAVQGRNRSEQSQEQLFAHAVESGSQEVPSSAFDWSSSKGYLAILLPYLTSFPVVILKGLLLEGDLGSSPWGQTPSQTGRRTG